MMSLMEIANISRSTLSCCWFKFSIGSLECHRLTFMKEKCVDQSEMNFLIHLISFIRKNLIFTERMDIKSEATTAGATFNVVEITMNNFTSFPRSRFSDTTRLS